MALTLRTEDPTRDIYWIYRFRSKLISYKDMGFLSRQLDGNPIKICIFLTYGTEENTPSTLQNLSVEYLIRIFLASFKIVL